jgi:transposase
MSTSLLYHTQGTRGFQFQSFDFAGGRTAVHLSRKAGQFSCPVCSSMDVRPTPVGIRIVRALPMGRQQCDLHVRTHRVRCHRCQAFKMEVLPFLPKPKARITRALARTIIELRSDMSIAAIARHFDLHWCTVKDVEKAHLQTQYKHISLKEVRHIGIDEVHVGSSMGDKGFLTIVRDMQSGAVLHIGKGRGSEALKGFKRRLATSKCQISAVAVDLAPSYTAWVIENLPDATLVYDHFHLIKLMNDKLDTIRRRVMGQLEEDDKKALKNRRWHFIRNEEDLDEDAKRQLERCREQFADLGTAWFMKESLRRIYSLAWDADTARLAFERWCELADETEIPQLKTMSKTITRHMDGITAYWTTGITSAAMEGFNNKIRWLNSQAYGYQDEEYFILKIFDLPRIKTRRDL